MTPKEKTEIAVRIAEIVKDISTLGNELKKLEEKINTLYTRTSVILLLLVTYIGSSSETGGDMIRHVLLSFLGGN